MSISSAYDVLGLELNSKTSIKEVHDAYHALALEYHPDKNLTTADEATAKFQTIQAAYASILKESALSGDREDGKTQPSSKLAKPWAPKRGRKFKHRAMQEVEELKEKVARAAAQRALDEVVELEGAQRPTQKRRAKQWDKERRKAEAAIAREKEAETNVQARLAQKAQKLSKKTEVTSVAKKSTDASKDTETSIARFQEQALVLSSGAPLSSYLKHRPDAIIEKLQAGAGNSIVTEHIRTDRVALIDAEISKLEEELEMRSEIPDEYSYPSNSSDPISEEDPIIFIEQFNTPGNPEFAESFCKKFPQFSEIVGALGGDFGLILEGLKQQKLNEEKNRRQEEEEAEEKVAAFEKYWASHKKPEPAASTTTISKRGRRQSPQSSNQAQEFNKAYLASHNSRSTGEKDPQLPTINQETIAPTRWNRSETEEDSEDSDEGDGDQVAEDPSEFLWEQETEAQFHQRHDEVDQVQLAFKMRRGEALVTALEYQSGMLLENSSNTI